MVIISESATERKWQRAATVTARRFGL